MSLHKNPGFSKYKKTHEPRRPPRIKCALHYSQTTKQITNTLQSHFDLTKTHSQMYIYKRLWALWTLSSHNKMHCTFRNIKLMLENVSINVLFSRLFNFSTVVGALNISPPASIKMTKTEKL